MVPEVSGDAGWSGASPGQLEKEVGCAPEVETGRRCSDPGRRWQSSEMRRF